MTPVLLHPNSLERFLTNEKGELFAGAAMNYLREQLPPAFFKKPLETSPVLRAEPASKTILPELLKRADYTLSKSDYFLIAHQMKTGEIPPEVTDKLNEIQKLIGIESGKPQQSL